MRRRNEEASRENAVQYTGKNRKRGDKKGEREGGEEKGEDMRREKTQLTVLGSTHGLITFQHALKSQGASTIKAACKLSKRTGEEKRGQQ